MQGTSGLPENCPVQVNAQRPAFLTTKKKTKWPATLFSVLNPTLGNWSSTVGCEDRIAEFLHISSLENLSSTVSVDNRGFFLLSQICGEDVVKFIH